ncbi:MAG: SOS response-associated peptidase [Cytophagaceae bacterium]
MCGRYSLAQTGQKITERYQIKQSVDFKPRYNVAPGQTMPVICSDAPTEIRFCRWGLIPNWSMNESVGFNHINAKAEHFLTKAPFKQIAKNQRCLIPADGYYEWKKEGKQKNPYRITLSNDQIFSFAGLWDSWENYDGDLVHTFTIITTPANSLVGELFDRMPFILDPSQEQNWLNEKLQEEEISAMVVPYDGNKMSYYKTHKSVDKPDYDTPECIQVAPKIYPGETFFLFDM